MPNAREIRDWNNKTPNITPDLDPRYDTKVAVSLRTLWRLVSLATHKRGDEDVCTYCDDSPLNCESDCIRDRMWKFIEEKLPPKPEPEPHPMMRNSDGV